MKAARGAVIVLWWDLADGFAGEEGLLVGRRIGREGEVHTFAFKLNFGGIVVDWLMFSHFVRRFFNCGMCEKLELQVGLVSRVVTGEMDRDRGVRFCPRSDIIIV